MTMTPEAAATSKDLVVNDRVTIPSRDLSWSASRASGPGGQNVNKVATKVTLRFDLRGTGAMNAAQKARLRKLAGSRIDALGFVVLSAQAERSQRQNLDRTRDRLRKLIARSLVPPKRRVPTRPSKASKRRRMDEKRRRGEQKRARGKVSLSDD